MSGQHAGPYCIQRVMPDSEKRKKNDSVCETCIAGYDHHCPWTGKCIGKGNLQEFYNFLFIGLFSFLYIMVATACVPLMRGKAPHHAASAGVDVTPRSAPGPESLKASSDAAVAVVGTGSASGGTDTLRGPTSARSEPGLDNTHETNAASMKAPAAAGATTEEDAGNNGFQTKSRNSLIDGTKSTTSDADQTI